MSNYRSTRDLKKGVLHRIGELTDNTSGFSDQVIEYLNRAQLAVLSGSAEFDIEIGLPWRWAKSKYPGIDKFEKKVDEEVAFTTDSTSASFSSAPSVSYQGWYLKPSGREEFYRIASHSAMSTSITLDQNYLGDSETLSVDLYKLDYELSQSNILRLIAPLRVFDSQDIEGDDEGQIDGMDFHEMSRQYPLHLIETGVPTIFSIFHEDVSEGKFTIRPNKIPNDDDVRFEFDYIPYPEDLFEKTFDDSDVNISNEQITITDHNISADTPVYLDNLDGALPTGLSKTTLYYVNVVDSDTITLATTIGGSPVDVTAASGGGTHLISNVPKVPRQHRIVLEYIASYYLALDKADERAQSYLELAQASLKALAAASSQENTHTSFSKSGRIIPRRDLVAKGRRRVVQEVTD